jgi:hypothetical protein
MAERSKGESGESKAIAVTLGVGVAAVTAFFLAPKIAKSINESDIVAGVPAQVERAYSEKTCVSYMKTFCLKYETDYYLGVEQCPADIDAARQGRQTTTFNPKVGAIYEGCVYDTVKVGAETYNGSPTGSTITFSGPVGGYLHS